MQWFQCVTCKGQFLSQAELERAFAEAQPGRELELVEHNDGSPRLQCPVCHELTNVAWVEFLRLLRCPDHGYWFEPGQLEGLLAFDVTPESLPNFQKAKSLNPKN